MAKQLVIIDPRYLLQFSKIYRPQNFDDDYSDQFYFCLIQSILPFVRLLWNKNKDANYFLTHHQRRFNLQKCLSSSNKS